MKNDADSFNALMLQAAKTSLPIMIVSGSDKVVRILTKIFRQVVEAERADLKKGVYKQGVLVKDLIDAKNADHPTILHTSDSLVARLERVALGSGVDLLCNQGSSVDTLYAQGASINVLCIQAINSESVKDCFLTATIVENGVSSPARTWLLKDIVDAQKVSKDIANALYVDTEK